MNLIGVTLTTIENWKVKFLVNDADKKILLFLGLYKKEITLKFKIYFSSSTWLLF